MIILNIQYLLFILDYVYEDVLLDESNVNTKKMPELKNKQSRAKSFQELYSRLDKFKGKKKLMYKEKLQKKKIKNQLKKKSKRDERNAQSKLDRAMKITVKDEIKEEKPDKTDLQQTKQTVFNKDDKLVYSKIDFANLGKKKKVKLEKDPKKLLQKIEKQKEKIEKLKESGENEKAIEIKEKSAWKNALAKAEGQKVKDDPQLLMKSLKKKEQKKRSSKKKWDKRVEGVQKSKQEKQQKRMENIQKRKKEKKTNKLKKAAKKGKIIPGF